MNAMSSAVCDAISVSNARWSFGGSVAQTFDQHVSRSVPQYQQGHEIVVSLSDFFLRNGSTAYDVGCSTGELTYQLAMANRDRDISIIGLEIEPAMVTAAKQKTTDFPNISIQEANILDVDLMPANLIVSYYTIQFIQPVVRQIVFDKIYSSLNWGGWLPVI